MGTSKPPVVVAVVEDDAPSRRALGRLLQAAGFEPLLFESAEAYIEASVAPTCLIVDVYLPGMSGIELQQRLRRRRPRAADHRDDFQSRNGHTGARAPERVRRVLLEARRRQHPGGHDHLAHTSLARMGVGVSTRPRVLVADDWACGAAADPAACCRRRCEWILRTERPGPSGKSGVARRHNPIMQQTRRSLGARQGQRSERDLVLSRMPPSPQELPECARIPGVTAWT